MALQGLGHLHNLQRNGGWSRPMRNVLMHIFELTPTPATLAPYMSLVARDPTGVWAPPLAGRVETPPCASDYYIVHALSGVRMFWSYRHSRDWNPGSSGAYVASCDDAYNGAPRVDGPSLRAGTTEAAEAQRPSFIPLVISGRGASPRIAIGVDEVRVGQGPIARNVVFLVSDGLWKAALAGVFDIGGDPSLVEGYTPSTYIDVAGWTIQTQPPAGVPFHRILEAIRTVGGAL